MRKKIFGLVLSFIIAAEIVVPVGATSISGIRNQRNQTQQNLNQVTGQISDLQSQRDVANTELEALDKQLVEILTSIEILQEEIELKQKEIDIARGDLTAAQETEADQYDNMKKRIQFMYEEGNMVYMQALLGAVNYSDMVNKAEYVEKLFSYDRKLLDEYVQNRKKVEELKMTLEDEQSQMRTAEYELEGEQENLAMLAAIKRKTVEDFDAQLEDAKKQASAYKSQLKQQTQRIRQMEEAKRKKEEERKKKEEEKRQQEQEQSGNTDGTTSVDVNTGQTDGGDDDLSAGAGSELDTDTESDYDYDSSSGLGQQICDYASQFVGNPYVFGGTSLTNGADCSGFTQSVFAHFGISIPRDSFSQRSCGYEVAYEDAQPGDLICYAGHVALYIGNGQIIHASTERTGITYGYATYRTILAVRRVI